MSHVKKEEHGKKQRKRRLSCGKTEADREAWLPDVPREVETSGSRRDV
jgi:hypothetical protein